jgi:hypothetical protein
MSRIAGDWETLATNEFKLGRSPNQLTVFESGVLISIWQSARRTRTITIDNESPEKYSITSTPCFLE